MSKAFSNSLNFICKSFISFVRVFTLDLVGLAIVEKLFKSLSLLIGKYYLTVCMHHLKGLIYFYMHF